MADQSKVKAQLKTLRKKFGGDIILKLKDKPMKFDVISSGCMAIDQATGIGGFPRKHSVMYWGKENGGKTTLAQCFAASVIRGGGTPLFVDMEKKGSEDWIRTCISQYDVNPDELYIAQPETGPQALDVIRGMVPVVDAVILDSIYHLVPANVLDANSAGDNFPAHLSKLLSPNMKALKSILGASNCVFLMTNQMRYKFASMPGANPETIPGGRVVMQDNIMIMKLQQVGRVKRGKNTIGIDARAYFQKNQAGPPYLQANYRIKFDRGLDVNFDVMETAKGTVIEQRGAWYDWRPDEEIGFHLKGWESEGGVMNHIEEHPEKINLIRKDLESENQGLDTLAHEYPHE